MIYIVELKTRVEGMKVTQCNEFKGKHKLEEHIQKWIYEVRKEFGNRDLKIESVTVNGKEMKIKKP